jgi:hypothetical protein
MSRKHLPEGLVDRTGLRRWFFEHHGYCPGWYTISEAIRQGLPCEPHPLLEGKLVFDVLKVQAWLEDRRKRPVPKAPPLRAALAH